MSRPRITILEVRKNFFKSYLLVAIMIAVVFGLGYVIGYYMGNVHYGVILAAIACVVMIPIQLLTAKFAILSMTKGKPLNLNDPRHRRLKSITEGLTISAGMSRVPDIYVMPTSVPNAFASGISEKNAFIGVTEGLLNMLDDRELTGVVAHEISHIVHRDIMLSQITVALVSVIMFLSMIASRMAYFMRPRGRDRNSGGGIGLIILAMVIFSVLIRPLAMIIANLLMLAVSRKREYAADAYAVRLCGYNEGLASALAKLGGLKQLSSEQKASLGGDTMKPMYIHYQELNSLFATHPPIDERVRRLLEMY